MDVHVHVHVIHEGILLSKNLLAVFSSQSGSLVHHSAEKLLHNSVLSSSHTRTKCITVIARLRSVGEVSKMCKTT